MNRRPEKKRERDDAGAGQLPLPAPPTTATPPAATRLLPMQLTVGDRLIDETGDWEITVRPYTSPGGKTVHARVRRIDQPDTVEERTWGAHERIAVRRGGL